MLVNRVREVRIKKKMPQTLLAEMCGINRRTLHRLERGETNININTAFDIAEKLRTPINELFKIKHISNEVKMKALMENW